MQAQPERLLQVQTKLQKQHENKLCPEEQNFNSKDTPKHANTFLERESAGLEIAALTHIRKSQIKIPKQKTS